MSGEDTPTDCQCKHSDAWRCAKSRNSRELSCSCECHRANQPAETPTAVQDGGELHDQAYVTATNIWEALNAALEPKGVTIKLSMRDKTAVCLRTVFEPIRQTLAAQLLQAREEVARLKGELQVLLESDQRIIRERNALSDERDQLRAEKAELERMLTEYRNLAGGRAV